MTPAELTELLYQEKSLQRGCVLEVHITENKVGESIGWTGKVRGVGWERMIWL